MADTPKIKLFISYSHKDKELCNELQNHLSPLKQENLIEYWQDKELLPGENWDEEIKKNLRQADIVVFLLSADFLASPYIYNNEIKIAYEKHQKGEVTLVPVMLRKCHIDKTIFKNIQGLPTPFEPITSSKWPSRDEYFYEIVVGLERFIDSVKEKRERIEKYKNERINREKERIEREKAIKEKERIEQGRKEKELKEKEQKERKEKERKEQDEIVRKELERAEDYFSNKKYDAAFPIYYKYRDNKFFNSNYQAHLGYMYEEGFGVIQDYKEALKWYQKSADQGNAVGQNNLGLLYAKGLGISTDYGEALKWFRKAAEQEYALGQNNLGLMFRDGNGVTQNYSEAMKWFQKAADKGYAIGQFNLARIHENGKGGEKDLFEAKKLYIRAAKQGNKYAQDACTRLNIKW